MLPGATASGATAMRSILLAAMIAFIALGTAAQDAGAPEWFLDDIARLTAEGGRWVADNSPYKNENEPYDAYGLEWRSSFDGTTMTGRLFGLIDGEESGTFWEFRQYWHPGAKKAVLEQFGWNGVVGVGVIWPEGEAMKTAQTFYDPDGGERRAGHINSFRDADTQISESYDIVDGEWKPRRRYVWKRAPAAQSQ